jgi:hypothetical protein
MLNKKMIQEAIASSAELKEVFVEVLNTKAFVKKFTRKDSSMLISEEDTVSVMVYVGVVDDEGVRVFESAEEVSNLSNKITTELFKHVNDYNTESVEKQAKK